MQPPQDKTSLLVSSYSRGKRVVASSGKEIDASIVNSGRFGERPCDFNSENSPRYDERSNLVETRSITHEEEKTQSTMNCLPTDDGKNLTPKAFEQSLEAIRSSQTHVQKITASKKEEEKEQTTGNIFTDHN